MQTDDKSAITDITFSLFKTVRVLVKGAEPLIQLYKILLKAPGVYGARFSGAGFRGCCVAFVDAETAEEAASYVKDEYEKAQPEFAKKLKGKPVLICEAGDSARVL